MRHEFNERLAFFAALCSSFLHHVYSTRIIFFSLVRYGFYNSNYTAHTSTYLSITIRLHVHVIASIYALSYPVLARTKLATKNN